ncbi:MAG TPA: amidohydrolase family protein [Pseudonocardia sp.]|nr:amidohydrolase family protein [Pseudonocardia sp.]
MTATLLLAADTVVTDGLVGPGWVEVAGERISAVGAGPSPRTPDVNLGDAVLVPGFVDMHVHGGAGAAFPDGDPEEAMRAVRFHRAHGSTTMVASLVAAAPAELLRAVDALAELVADDELAGVHLEGPWLAEARCGAHDPRQLRDADPGELDRLLRAGQGAVRMVTLAEGSLPAGQWMEWNRPIRIRASALVVHAAMDVPWSAPMTARPALRAACAGRQVLPSGLVRATGLGRAILRIVAAPGRRREVDHMRAKVIVLACATLLITSCGGTVGGGTGGGGGAGSTEPVKRHARAGARGLHVVDHSRLPDGRNRHDHGDSHAAVHRPHLLTRVGRVDGDPGPEPPGEPGRLGRHDPRNCAAPQPW